MAAIQSQALARKVFDACDADGDGVLSYKDLETTLRRIAGKHSGGRAAFASADKNGDGVLQYDEFFDSIWRAKKENNETKASEGAVKDAERQNEEDEEENKDDLLPRSTYFESHNLGAFIVQMASSLNSKQPEDPYTFMMEHIVKHRPMQSMRQSKQSASTSMAPSPKGKATPKKKKSILVNISAVLRKSPRKVLDMICEMRGVKLIEESNDNKSHIYFTWDSVSFLKRLGHPSSSGGELVPQLGADAWVNRLPGMGHLCDKVNMTLALRLLQQLWPEKFRFWPKSWLLPAETEQLRGWLTRKKGETVIVKPADGSLGEGIFLCADCSDFDAKLMAKPNWGAGFGALAQRYLAHPLLLNGLKFDLRLYAVVTSTDPLCAYLCREGLARFCTTRYEEPTAANSSQHYMHLSNYSVNKKSTAFVKATDPFDPDSKASKRPLSTLMRQIAAQEAASGRIFDEKNLFSAFEEIIVVLLQAVAPVLNVTYDRVAKESTRKPKAKAKPKAKSRGQFAKDEEDDEEEEDDDEDDSEDGGFQPQCFQMIGVDVLIDDKLQPWLLEINGRPSMDIDEPVRMSEAPEGKRRCPCRDMDGEEHCHMPSAVDVHVKTMALGEAFDLVVAGGDGEATPNYVKLDFDQHSPVEDLQETMQLIARLFQVAGGSQKAFTTYGCRRALAGAIEAGLDVRDLDAAVTRWKHQGYRVSGDLDKDMAEIGVLDFAGLLQEVALRHSKDEEEEPIDALTSLLANCDPD
eukprot:TRINITY_DN31052_c0_g1_i1.p1 TRINITY_DN31052_c0_g1~~TRINITY_DN31052_c0_g1_i1.p1  ORF type:complete len:747 (-),score=176.38 TRINITY_DN31052_c0_g1_i1:56-2296(-)